MVKQVTSYLPPVKVAREANRGLELRKKFGRGGTSIGIARAKQLISRKAVSADTVKRMYSYFARHLVDKKGKNFFNETKPSNGAIAWLLWGGDPGANWAHDTWKRIRKNRKK